MSAIVRWEDPPPRHVSPRKNWAAIAAELMSNPKHWAVVEVGTRPMVAGVVQQINHGRLLAFRPVGHFEACTRTNDGEMVVYARYIGGRRVVK